MISRSIIIVTNNNSNATNYRITTIDNELKLSQFSLLTDASTLSLNENLTDIKNLPRTKYGNNIFLTTSLLLNLNVILRALL